MEGWLGDTGLALSPLFTVPHSGFIAPAFPEFQSKYFVYTM